MHNYGTIVVEVNPTAAVKLWENPAYDSRYQPHTLPSAGTATSTLERRQLEHTYESLHVSDF